MVAHFVTSRDLPLSAFREGTNRHLPRDVAIRDADEAHADFHARFDARGKWYRYTLYLGLTRSPLASRTSWHIRSSIDLDAMAAGAAAFVGTHDFAAFRSSACEAKTTVRTIFSVDLVREGDLLHIDVKGSGFLKNMVRVMVGTLLEIGLGKRPPGDVELLLREGFRSRAGRTAPSCGLCLMEVWYEVPPVPESP
jgi:tRNA pseudouridine38-40 synthase